LYIKLKGTEIQINDLIEVQKIDIDGEMIKCKEITEERYKEKIEVINKENNYRFSKDDEKNKKLAEKAYKSSNTNKSEIKNKKNEKKMEETGNGNVQKKKKNTYSKSKSSSKRKTISKSNYNTKIEKISNNNKEESSSEYDIDFNDNENKINNETVYDVILDPFSPKRDTTENYSEYSLFTLRDDFYDQTSKENLNQIKKIVNNKYNNKNKNNINNNINNNNNNNNNNNINININTINNSTMNPYYNPYMNYLTVPSPANKSKYGMKTNVNSNLNFVNNNYFTNNYYSEHKTISNNRNFINIFGEDEDEDISKESPFKPVINDDTQSTKNHNINKKRSQNLIDSIDLTETPENLPILSSFVYIPRATLNASSKSNSYSLMNTFSSQKNKNKKNCSSINQSQRHTLLAHFPNLQQININRSKPVVPIDTTNENYDDMPSMDTINIDNHASPPPILDENQNLTINQNINDPMPSMDLNMDMDMDMNMNINNMNMSNMNMNNMNMNNMNMVRNSLLVNPIIDSKDNMNIYTFSNLTSISSLPLISTTSASLSNSISNHSNNDTFTPTQNTLLIPVDDMPVMSPPHN